MKPPTGFFTTSVPATTSEACETPTLKVSGLACRRGNEWLFRGLDFAVYPGQMVWLRGHNGSGKTTLLRVVSGLAHADEGELSWSPALEETLSGVGRLVYIGHLNAMKDDLTVCESLQFMARLHGRDGSEEAVLAALRKLGMHHRRHAAVRTLSQGQRRRAALARLALEHSPSLWVLDEPYDALDTAGIETVNALLGTHLLNGGCVLLTSHLALGAAAPEARELLLDKGMVA